MNIPNKQLGFDELMSNEIEGEDYAELLWYIRTAAKLEALKIVNTYSEEGDTTFETLLTVDGVTFPVKFEYHSHNNAAQIERAAGGDEAELVEILAELKSAVQ